MSTSTASDTPSTRRVPGARRHPSARAAAMGTRDSMSAGPRARWRVRVAPPDWNTIGAQLNNYGCPLTGPLLTPGEAADIASLYSDDMRFRSTINMGRHRLGEGESRYFAEPFPDAVVELKQALYPKLLPIARE